MKRLLFIAVIWGAALLPAAQAQRGMGFRGGGVAPPARGPSGFAGRPSGFAGRPAGVPSAGFASRPTGFAGRPGPTFSSATRGRPATGVRFVSPRSHVFVSGHRAFVSGHRAFFPHHFRHFHHFANNSFFFPHSCFNGFFDSFCNNGFFFGSSFIGPFDPFFDGFPTPVAEQQPTLVEDSGNSGELALQIQQLSDEVQSLRDEQRAREERRSAATQPAVQDLSPDTIFVFHDGLQLSARNYAIAGETLWVLDEHKARKIPLSKVDIPATEQANAKNGVEVHFSK